MESDNKANRLRRVGLPVAVLVGLIGLTVAVIVIWREPLLAVFTDRDRMSAAIRETGAFGPLVFVAIQVVQTAVAPIPGQITGIVGGAVFGWLGLVWSMVGSIVGAFLVLKLVRRFGRPLAEKIVSPTLLEKFDFVIGRQGAMTLFLMFLLPIFPDSILCYLAGLTTLPIRTLMVIWIVGRLPSSLVNNLIGEGLGRAAIRPIVLVVLLCVILLVVVLWKRRQIHDFVAAENHRQYLRKNWPHKMSSTILGSLVTLVVVAGIAYLVLTV